MGIIVHPSVGFILCLQNSTRKVCQCDKLVFHFSSRHSLFLVFGTCRVMISSFSELSVEKAFYVLDSSFHFYVLPKGSKFLVLKKRYDIMF